MVPIHREFLREGNILCPRFVAVRRICRTSALIRFCTPGGLPRLEGPAGKQLGNKQGLAHNLSRIHPKVKEDEGPSAIFSLSCGPGLSGSAVRRFLTPPFAANPFHPLYLPFTPGSFRSLRTRWTPRSRQLH